MTSARRQQKKRVLFICGSMNQTTQMHRVASELSDCDCFFTPYYADGIVEALRRMGLMEFTIIGQPWRQSCLAYLTEHRVAIDFGGERGPYDLVLTCQDLFIPANVLGTKGLLVQEGMTDPEGLGYELVKRFSFLPRWLASTAATGLSGWFDRFCVASEGYAELFARKGVDPSKIVVTGIPNFDDCASYAKNDFPHRGFVLVCTSDARETFKLHDRRAVIESAVRIARGRQLIFKLHPNEKFDRAKREIARFAPGALVYTSGTAEHMIANCEALVTEYSSTAFVGLVLGKEVHSEFPIEELRRLLPLQNRCAARNIAGVCRELLGDRAVQATPAPERAASAWWPDVAMMVP
jgi:hypothetical protein